jgi:hypothetical protein
MKSACHRSGLVIQSYCYLELTKHTKEIIFYSLFAVIIITVDYLLLAF